MKDIINFFLHPMSWLVIGFLILRLFGKRWKPLYKKSGYFLMFLIFYFSSTRFVPRMLYFYLEDQYQPLNPENLDAKTKFNIIILGSGVGFDQRLPSTTLLESTVLARLVEGIRVSIVLPNTYIITSGDSSSGKKAQGDIVKEAAILLGVPENRLYAQVEPSNTMEEAQTYVKKFGTQTPLIISTSAAHMPRAVYLFNQAGVKTVYAAPCNYKVKKDSLLMVHHFIKPDLRYMYDIGSILHEIIGLWYAKRQHA